MQNKWSGSMDCLSWATWYWSSCYACKWPVSVAYYSVRKCTFTIHITQLVIKTCSAGNIPQLFSNC